MSHIGPSAPMSDPPGIKGDLRKLGTEQGSPVRYELRIGDQSLALNPLLSRRIHIEATGKIHCVACGRATRKSFSGGHCFPCARSLARCDTCYVAPKLCHYHQGSCREPDWGLANCMRPHVVYLSNTSGLKVGITGASNTITRWLDQGAVQALPIFRAHTRRQSGIIEAALGKQVSERTDWRRMLTGDPAPLDLAAERDRLLETCKQDIATATDELEVGPPSLIDDAVEARFDYPIIEYPRRAMAIDLAKHAQVDGMLLGIKGQYLILSCGVVNVRKHAGYEVEFSFPLEDQPPDFNLEMPNS